MSAVLVVGESGNGKSTSIRGLDPKTTIVFSTLGKGIPIKGARKNYTIYSKEGNPNGNIIISSSSKVIMAWLKYINEKMPHITTIVIDDATFLAAKELDRRKDEKTYDKFNDIAHEFLAMSELANTLREDLNIYFMYHATVEGDGILDDKKTKALSHGKMISEKLASIEAQFEIVLLACKLSEGDNIVYRFKTRDMNSTAKTPLGMFEDEFIDNDLGYVNEMIRCYYNEECK